MWSSGGHTGPMRILALALSAVLASGLLAGCSQEDADRAVDAARDRAERALEDVDWEKYGDRFRDEIEGLVAEADCEGLKEELAKVEGNDTEITEYLKAQLEQLDC